LTPSTGEPDQDRRQGLLNLVLLALAVPGFLFGVVSAISWISGNPQGIVGTISGLGVQLFYLGAYWLGRRGRVRLAGFIPVGILFVIMAGSTIQQGIGHSPIIGYSMIVLTAGILIGIAPAFVFAFLCTLVYVYVGLTQAAGELPAAIPPEATVLLDSAAIGFGLVVILGFYWLNNREITLSFRRERELSTKLQEQQEDLEQRVDLRTRELERRAIQMRAAAEVGRAATTIRDLETLLTKATHLISERFGFYHAGIFLLDSQGEYAVLQAANSEGGQRMLARNHKLKVGEVGIVGYVTGHNVPRIALDVGEEAIYFDNPDLPETRSEMALPLIVGDNILGALDVQSKLPGAFSEEDISTLEVLADQIAIAIENARLIRDTQDALETTQRAFGEMGIDAWRDLIGQDQTWGYRYDIHSPETVARIIAKHDALTQQAIANQEIVRDDQRVVIPLQVRGEAIGVLNVERSISNFSWSEQELSLLDTIADQLSLTLDSARLYQDTQQRAATERMVGDITTRIRETLNIDSVIKTAANEIYEALDLEHITIRLTDDNSPPPEEDIP
jgi:GAF domain-containing protein